MLMAAILIIGAALLALHRPAQHASVNFEEKQTA